MSDDAIRFTTKLGGGSDVARLLRALPGEGGAHAGIPREAGGPRAGGGTGPQHAAVSGFRRRRGSAARRRWQATSRRSSPRPTRPTRAPRRRTWTHADRFWANIQNRRFARARKALAESPSKWRDLPVGRLDPKLHQESRTGPQANVTRREPAQIVTSRKALDTYIKRRSSSGSASPRAPGSRRPRRSAGGCGERPSGRPGTGRRPGSATVKTGSKPSVTLDQPARLHGRRDDRDRHPARAGSGGGEVPPGAGHFAAEDQRASEPERCVAVRLILLDFSEKVANSCNVLAEIMQVEIPDEVILDTLRMGEAVAGLADWRGKIARMLESGELISLRRGLYASRRDLDPHCLAGPIYGPSYLSFETALAWHGMIPEGVTEILSATLKRSASFENAFGRYRYLAIPKSVYPVGDPAHHRLRSALPDREPDQGAGRSDRPRTRASARWPTLRAGWTA